jgi:hypothetical protein
MTDRRGRPDEWNALTSSRVKQTSSVWIVAARIGLAEGRGGGALADERPRHPRFVGHSPPRQINAADPTRGASPPSAQRTTVA